MTLNNKLVVSASPHDRSHKTVRSIMLDVIIALLPAVIMGTIIFGLRALLVVSVTVVAAVLSEYLFNLIAKKQQTLGDLSAEHAGDIAIGVDDESFRLLSDDILLCLDVFVKVDVPIEVIGGYIRYICACGRNGHSLQLEA